MPIILQKSWGAGIWPVTVATTLLKPGGYQRLSQMAEKLQERGVMLPFKGVDVNAVSELAVMARTDKHQCKSRKAASFQENETAGSALGLLCGAL